MGFQSWKWRGLFPLRRHVPGAHDFPAVLKSCSDLLAGESLHAAASKLGLDSDPYIASSLVSMYSRHCSFRNAHQMFDEIPDPNPVAWNTAISSLFRSGNCNAARALFDRMPSPNLITWSAVVSGYAQNGCLTEALHVFVEMKRGFGGLGFANSNTVASVLSACARLRDIRFGEQIHGYTRKVSSYVEDDEFVGAALVDTYGKCGCIELARRCFDAMGMKNVVAWSTLIANYIGNDDPLMAVEAFKEMMKNGTAPNSVTLTSLATACSRLMNLSNGKELHGFMIRRLSERRDIFVSTALINLYGKCQIVPYAQRIFKMHGDIFVCQSTPMWNAMISAYVAGDRLDDAWGMIRIMAQSLSCGVLLNPVTMAIILPICARSTLLLNGQELHCYAVKNELDKEILVGNGLLDMYSKCGKIDCAKNQFDLMPEKNRITWTTLIDGYGMNNQPHAAISIFEMMVSEKNVEPDHITFVALISACSHSGLVEEGLRYFDLMTHQYGIIPREENYGCLVDLLARAGHIDEARHVIEKMPINPGGNVWGALLGACKIHGDVYEAEFASDHLEKLDLNESGFRALLSHLYAQTGRSDCAMKIQRSMVEMGLYKRQGCCWIETKEDFGRHVVLG